METSWNLVIVSDPEIMSGTPCFRGTRVPFKNLIDYLEGGHPLVNFLGSSQQFRSKRQSRLEDAKDSLLARIPVRPEAPLAILSARRATLAVDFSNGSPHFGFEDQTKLVQLFRETLMIGPPDSSPRARRAK